MKYKEESCDLISFKVLIRYLICSVSVGKSFIRLEGNILSDILFTLYKNK